MLFAALCFLFASIIVSGVIAAAYYWRWKYEEISERMHNAIPLIDEGRVEEARDLLEDH